MYINITLLSIFISEVKIVFVSSHMFPWCTHHNLKPDPVLTEANLK